MAKYKESKIFVLCEIALLVSIVLLARFGGMYAYRYGASAIALGILLILLPFTGYHLRDFGLRLDNFKISIRPFLILTLVIILAESVVFGTVIAGKSFKVFVYSSIMEFHLGGYHFELDLSAKHLFIKRFLLYGILFCFFQEFLFRGYLLCRLRILCQNEKLVILVLSTLFAFSHIPLHSVNLIIGAFCVSVVWTWLYIRYQNLIAIFISHFICGFSGYMLWLIIKHTPYL